MILTNTQQDGGSNMKAEITCDCGTKDSTNTLESVKALYNPCDKCGGKQEVKLVGAPSKGAK